MKRVVVMPAYNAAKTLTLTFNSIPKDMVDEIILVDDASTDNTCEIAKKLGIKTVVHPKNLGYGANQKTCYSQGLRLKGDIIIMIHPDYQYDGQFIPKLISPIEDGQFDIMLGSRIRSREEAMACGMPFYKYIGNRFLSTIEKLILRQHLSEFHTGFRAFSRKALEMLPFQQNSNDFVFDQEIIIQACYFRLRIGEIPIPTRYFKEASSIDFCRSLLYGLKTIMSLIKFMIQLAGLWNFKIFCRR